METVEAGLETLDIAVEKGGISVDNFQVDQGLSNMPPTMSHLVMGAVNRFDKASGAIATPLSQYGGDTQGAQSMAKRLSQRTDLVKRME